MRRGSQVFELFGYPVDNWNETSAANMRQCHCPFMDAECDGGGNRYISSIDLSKNKGLRVLFPDKSIVQAGVCSLQLKPGEQPWIVCPRRLLNYRAHESKTPKSCLKKKLCQLAELPKGLHYAVWSEIKLKCPLNTNGRTALFDYTFDYVIAATLRVSLRKAADILRMKENEVRALLEEMGFTTAFRNGEWFCDDFPSAPFVIVEVMTSSTSGGNKKCRTQISQLFEDTVRRLSGEAIEAAGPGINYRQVWARMVSQLLVKSQIAIRWGGLTFWVLQDLLADYITRTTALDLNAFLSEHFNEVNVISGGYGRNADPKTRTGALADIDDIKFYSGTVSGTSSSERSFSDIIKLGAMPDVSEFWRHLVRKRPCSFFEVK